MPTRLTASRLRLASYCTHWTSFEEQEEDQSEACRLGLAFHGAAERHIRGELADLNALAREFRLSQASATSLATRFTHFRRAMLEHGAESRSLLAEVSFAYDPSSRSARVLGYSLGRDYSSASPEEICGTADAVALTESTVDVYEWKTGKKSDWYHQLAFLALCAEKAFSRELGKVWVGHFPRAGGQLVETPTIDSLECCAFESQLRETRLSRFEPGWWCKGLSCPARFICPNGVAR